MSATQGPKREYETIFIMRPDSTEQITEGVKSRIDTVMENLEGNVLQYDAWGKRKLAYVIRDKTGQKNIYKGLYYYMRYSGNPELVPELERQFRMQEPVLRYMTIKLNGDFSDSPAAPTETPSDDKAAAASA